MWTNLILEVFDFRLDGRPFDVTDALHNKLEALKPADDKLDIRPKLIDISLQIVHRLRCFGEEQVAEHLLPLACVFLYAVQKWLEVDPCSENYNFYFSSSLDKCR